MSLSVGILGIGNCGGQIAALGKSTKNIPGMVINSSERVIDAVKSIGSIDAFILGDGRGAGLNRTIGKNYVKRNFKSLLENEAYKKFIDDIDYIFVVNSTGGGTGSSFGPILTDVLNKYYRSKGVEKNFINVGILPAINNSIGHQRNTLEYLKEMVDLGLSYMLFDNNTLGDATNDIIFEKINSEVVDAITILRGDYSRMSAVEMLDEMDMHRLIMTPGMIFINNLHGIYTEKMKGDATIEDLLIDNIGKNNFMVAPDRDKVIQKAAYICNISEDLRSQFDTHFPKMKEMYGEPLEFLENYSINEDDDERANYCIYMMFGLSLPDNRLKNIITRIKDAEEALKKTKTSSLLDSALSLVSDYGDKNTENSKSEDEFDLDDIMSKY